MEAACPSCGFKYAWDGVKCGHCTPRTSEAPPDPAEPLRALALLVGFLLAMISAWTFAASPAWLGWTVAVAIIVTVAVAIIVTVAVAIIVTVAVAIIVTVAVAIIVLLTFAILTTSGEWWLKPIALLGTIAFFGVSAAMTILVRGLG
jgi:hypothetical protein